MTDINAKTVIGNVRERNRGNRTRTIKKTADVKLRALHQLGRIEDYVAHSQSITTVLLVYVRECQLSRNVNREICKN